jgi:hypothetical protein
MFGSIGGMEFLAIAVLALLLFRSATQDFKTTLEREVKLEEIHEVRKDLNAAGREVAEGVGDAARPDSPPVPTDPSRARDRSAAGPSDRQGDDASPEPAPAPPDGPTDGEKPKQS